MRKMPTVGGIAMFMFAVIFTGVEIYALTHFKPEISIPINGSIVILWVVLTIRNKLKSREEV